ncbi:MAG: hypothetical protein AAF797_16125 [Planctomycetota bacterium]
MRVRTGFGRRLCTVVSALALCSASGTALAGAKPVVVDNRTDQKIEVRLDAFTDARGVEQDVNKRSWWGFDANERSRLLRNGSLLRASEFRYQIRTDFGVTPEPGRVWVRKLDRTDDQLVVTVTDRLLPKLPDGVSAARVARASRYLASRKTAGFALTMMHVTSDLNDAYTLKVEPVIAQGERQRGAFKITVRHHWVSSWDGERSTSDLVYYFNAAGQFYAVQAGHDDCTAPPFVGANLWMTVLGNLVLEMIDEQENPRIRWTVQQLVDRADARGLLEFALKMNLN